MKMPCISLLSLKALLWLGLTSSAAPCLAAGDAMLTQELAGTFQRYNPAERVVRISNIDYGLPANQSFNEQLRKLRTGDSIEFRVEGYDAKGRDVVMEIQRK
jgi:hypothetical protein